MFFVKTDITSEFSVVDLVKTDSYSPVSRMLEKQSRMRFDQIHIKPTVYLYILSNTIRLIM